MSRPLLTKAVALFSCILPWINARAVDASLSVDMNSVVQNDFLGVNAVYHGFAFMPEQINKGMNDTDREREFDRVQRMGLNIARTWHRPNYACTETNGLWGTNEWNSTRMNALYSWLQAMKDRNVDVALQLGWWFTSDTYYGHESPNPTNDPPTFAAWVSESLHQIIEVNGFTNVKYGILFTEPTSYDSGIIPSGYSKWSYYVKLVTAIHEQLVADGRRSLVKLVGPNNTSGAVNLTDAVSQLNAQIDIFSGHNFNLTNYSQWYNLCTNMKSRVSSTGKPVWMDEWGKQDEAYRQTADYGNYVAQGIAATLNAGIQHSMIWMLFDQQYISVDWTVGNAWNGADSFYNGVHRWGFARWPRDTMTNSTLPYPSWYAFSMMSKYLGGRGGTEVYRTVNSNNVYISAVKQPGGDWSFLVVNGNATAKSIQVNLSTNLNRTVCRYLFDPAQIVPTEAAAIIATDQQLSATTNFTDTLPSRGVAIYSTIGPDLELAPGENNTLVLSWRGSGFHLQSSESVSGSYTNEPGGEASPVTNTITGSSRFYRLSN